MRQAQRGFFCIVKMQSAKRTKQNHETKFASNVGKKKAYVFQSYALRDVLKCSIGQQTFFPDGSKSIKQMRLVVL